MTSDLSADAEPAPAAGELKHPWVSEPKRFKVTSGISLLYFKTVVSVFCFFSCTFITRGHKSKAPQEGQYQQHIHRNIRISMCKKQNFSIAPNTSLLKNIVSYQNNGQINVSP